MLETYKMAQTRPTGLPVQQQRSQDLQLPPPQSFDILPALHELLARIDHTSTDASALNDSIDPSESQGEIGALYTDLAPLEPKDLPVEVLQIKAKIRNALKELQKLPDMDRSVEEQQSEIEDLEDRIARQRAMIRKLGEVAKGVEGRMG